MDFLMSNSNKGMITNVFGNVLTVEDIESKEVTEIVVDKGFIEISEIEKGCLVLYDKEKKILTEE